MDDVAQQLASIGSIVSYDGRTHLVVAADDSWQVRLELEQLGDGEVVGVGAIWTAMAESRARQTAEVLVSGRIDERGIAVVRLVPLHDGRLDPVTMILRVAGSIAGQDPIVSEVLGVRGLAW